MEEVQRHRQAAAQGNRAALLDLAVEEAEEVATHLEPAEQVATLYTPEAGEPLAHKAELLVMEEHQHLAETVQKERREALTLLHLDQQRAEQ